MVDIEKLSKQWNYSLHSAVKRLQHMIEGNHRCDGRDREALSFLLVAFDKMENYISELEEKLDEKE